MTETICDVGSMMMVMIMLLTMKMTMAVMMISKQSKGRQLTETMPQFLELLVDSSAGCVFFLFYFSSIAVFILSVLISSIQAVFISMYFASSWRLLCKDPLSENFWAALNVTLPQCSMMSHSINVHCM